MKKMKKTQGLMEAIITETPNQQTLNSFIFACLA
jgi:hypothetical protein